MIYDGGKTKDDVLNGIVGERLTKDKGMDRQQTKTSEIFMTFMRNLIKKEIIVIKTIKMNTISVG